MRGQTPCSFFIYVNGPRGLTPWPKWAKGPDPLAHFAVAVF